MVVGIGIFVVGLQPSDNGASPLGLLAIGFLLTLVGFLAFALTLIGGATRVWRRQGWASKLVLAITFLLYGPLLFLSVAVIIHLI